MKILALIPARYESTRAPGKPLFDFCGKPMVVRVAEKCVKAGFKKEEVVVLTDDDRIVDAVQSHGFKVSKIEEECHSGADRICKWIDKNDISDDDMILNIQGDEPLIPVHVITQLREDLLHSRAVSIIRTIGVPLHPMDVMQGGGNVVKLRLTSGERVTDFSRTYIQGGYRHIGVYGYYAIALRKFNSLPQTKGEKLHKLEQLRWLEHGGPIHASIYPFEVPHGVDTKEQYEMALSSFKYQQMLEMEQREGVTTC